MLACAGATALACLLLWSAAVRAQVTPVPEGDFNGRLGPLVVLLHLKKAPDGTLSGTLDSPNQGARGLPCTDFHLDGSALSFKVPVVNGTWTGTVSADDSTLTGTWSQGTPLPLVFNRGEPPAETLASPPPPDPAMPPVEPAQLESVLRTDLKQTLATGVLGAGKGIGVAVGVVTKAGRRVFALGAAQSDRIFEIGSITKTFTGLTLAQLIEQGKLKPGTPVRELLSPGLVAKPEGAEITLLDLVTQHSGLPAMPDNFQPANPANPYADYDAARLQAFIGRHGVSRPADAGFLYSNLGFGLLGYALGRAAGEPYPQLLAEQVLKPLALKDTVITLSTAQQARFIPGHAADLSPVHAWDLDALAGAGAVRSTADDMLRYLQAQLDPDHIPAQGAAGHTLAAASQRSHELQADVAPTLRIAYAWLHDTATGTYWHNGATGGYSSYAFFNPDQGYAGVVLVNMTLGTRGSFADALGAHVAQRLTGRPAISLAGW